MSDARHEEGAAAPTPVPPEAAAPAEPDGVHPEPAAAYAEAAPAEEERPPAPPPQRGPSAGLILGGGLLVVLAVIATSPFWAGLLPWGPAATAAGDAGQLAALQQRVAAAEQARGAAEQRLDRLEQQVKELAAKAAAQPDTAGAVAPVEAAVKDLTGRVTQLEQRSAATADAQRNETAALQPLESAVKQLQDATRQLGTRLDDTARQVAGRLDQADQRLARIEAEDAASGARADRMLLVALDQLRGALDSSRPFAAELGAVTALAQGRPELVQALQPLEAPAKTGLPSVAVLAQRFEAETAPAILRAGAGPKTQGWADQMLARLRSLVTVRRTDPAATAGDPVEGPLAEAEAALGKGDLAGAVAALDKLPKGAKDAAQAWLGEARQRLAAEQAVGRASEDVAQKLAAAEQAGGKR